MLSKMACQICGAELLDARCRLLGVCGAPKCQLAWAGRLQARRQAELQLKNQQRYRLAEVHRDREALRLGIDQAQTISPAVVPANLRKIVSLPARRKRAFRVFLMELVARAAAVRTSSANPSPGETALDSAPSPPALESLLNRGCATCRGRCCNGGGDHAYLSIETILGYMHKHPKQRPRQVLKAYLSLLPKKSYEDSCVYQTEIGCALPREMRAKISGDFFCEELRHFQRQFYAGGERKIMFYAFEDSRVVRSEPFPDPTSEPSHVAEEPSSKALKL
jgi:hypothetical protein